MDADLCPALRLHLINNPGRNPWSKLPMFSKVGR